MAYPLQRDKVKVLLAAEAGELREADLVVQGFQRLGILDSSLRLTESGRFKLIASLPLSEQVRRLPVGYEQITTAKAPGVTTESYVADRYRAQGYECYEDEGGALALLRIYSLLSDVAALRSIVTDKFALESPIVSNLAQVFSHLENTHDGEKRLAPERVDRLCEILAHTSPERILAGRRVHQECSHANGLGGASDRYADPEKLLRLFHALGLARFLQVCRFELENAGGWPDITAFRGSEVVLIEVKQKDKLMFHQAQVAARLSALVPDTITAVRLARITLT
jgi:hypothetical protein